MEGLIFNRVDNVVDKLEDIITGLETMKIAGGYGNLIHEAVLEMFDIECDLNRIAYELESKGI